MGKLNLASALLLHLAFLAFHIRSLLHWSSPAPESSIVCTSRATGLGATGSVSHRRKFISSVLGPLQPRNPGSVVKETRLSYRQEPSTRPHCLSSYH